MNLKKLALAIAHKEAGKTEVDIAQISEILSVIPEIYNEYIAEADDVDVPFRINKFFRILTDDLKLGLQINEDGNEFSIWYKGRISNYKKGEQNDTN